MTWELKNQKLCHSALNLRYNNLAASNFINAIIVYEDDTLLKV